MPRGLFITFEGGEGAGKSTQILHLAEHLREQGASVLTTREPGGSPGAEAVRHVLLSGAAETLGPAMEAILFAAARSDHVEQVIRPAVESGTIVLCDRFMDSLRVYQGVTGELDSKFVSALERTAVNGMVPDLTIILDIEPEEGLRRAAEHRGAASFDRFEKETLDIQRRRRDAFLAIAKAEPERCVVVDASRDERAVAADVIAAADRLVGTGGKGAAAAKRMTVFERIAPEQHDTLPDVPEPSENPYLAGHEEAARQIAAAYRAGKLHHAILLAGPQGIGKATLAFHIAHHLLSHPRHEDAPATLAAPQPGSALARQLAGGAHPGLLHLTRPRNPKDGKFRGEITVGEIRRLNRFLSMKSHDGGYRVIIVDAVDDLNRSAANALLKNLEEPPERAVFVLVAHSLGRVLATIRSRCQTIRLSPLPAETLLDVLRRLPSGLEGDDAEAGALAVRAEGSVRDAILLAQFGGMEITTVADDIVGARRLDVARAHELASAVAARDQSIQFEILNRHLLDRVAAAARQAAEAGDAAGAGRLSELFEETSRAIAETRIYNLDRKQHVIGLLDRLNQAMRAG